MKKRILCWGVIAAMVFSSIALPTKSLAGEMEEPYDTYDEPEDYMWKSETQIYGVDFAYGENVMTLGIAATLMDSGAFEIALILKDSEHMLQMDVGDGTAKDMEEGRYPLLRGMNNDIFVNGNTLAYFVQNLTGEDDFLDWMKTISPEIEWICIDEDFLSMISDIFIDMPDSWDFENAIEQWADSLYVTEMDGGGLVASLNETTLLALTITLDQLGRSFQDSVNTFLKDDLKERFGDEITDAMMDSGSFSERSDAEAMMEKCFLNLPSTIRYSLYRYIPNSFWALLNADLTGWLLQGIGSEALEGMLEVHDDYGKLTLTEEDDSAILEAGRSDTLIWGRVVDSEGELYGSLVVNNDENEKSIFCRAGEKYINARMTILEPDTISVSLEDNIIFNQISGLITVEEDDSILFTIDSDTSMYTPLKSIRLYTTREEIADHYDLEIPEALDLDTVVYWEAYENMISAYSADPVLESERKKEDSKYE